MRNDMKALVKAEAREGLWMQDVPVPEIGPDDVLIKVHKTGICGTDVHIWNWDDWAQKTVPVPLVTGVPSWRTLLPLDSMSSCCRWSVIFRR